jgi:nucleotide-binding universal stress UspA family protein
MPGLRLTEEQVQRLCDVSASASASALRALVSAGFLRPLAGGTYGRVDTTTHTGTSAPSDAINPPWRSILCLIEFENDSHDSLTAASHAALGYATALGVTHRARVTVLHLAPTLPDTTAQQQPFVAGVAETVQKHVRSQIVPGLIDVHVAQGSSNEDLIRSATDLRADLIVLGRRDGGAACLSQLRGALRDAPCHVLIVHPSGQAAVA